MESHGRARVDPPLRVCRKCGATDFLPAQTGLKRCLKCLRAVPGEDLPKHLEGIVEQGERGFSLRAL